MTPTPTPEDEAAWIKYCEDNHWSADAETLHLARTDFLAGRASLREELERKTNLLDEIKRHEEIHRKTPNVAMSLIRTSLGEHVFYRQSLNNTETQDKGVG